MRLAAPAILLAGSGAAALVYQTLWVKQLGLVVGIDVYAVTTGVSAFFAGLALGSAVFGVVTERSARPLRVMALLELGTAVTALGATLLLARMPPWFVAVQQGTLPALAWALPAAAIGIPATLMGGTLPLVVRAVVRDDAGVGRMSGWLYAANTAGGVAGALATPFVLVPALGLRGAATVAAMLNVLVGAAAWLIARPLERRRDATRPGVVWPPGARLGLLLYGLAGAVALGYEVAWSQTIVQFVDTRAYAFAIVLATYLTGLVLGSALYGRFGERLRPWTAFAGLEMLVGASALLTLAALGAWLPRTQAALDAAVLASTGSRALATCLRFALAAATLVLLPTMLLGAAFPAAVRLTGGARDVGRRLGWVAAVNILGGIAGTFLTGFVAVPRLGLVRTLVLLATASAALGGLAAIYGVRRRALAVAIAAAAVTAGISLGLHIPADKLARLLVASRGGTLDFYEESAGATVAVVTEPHLTTPFRRLYIQGASNSGDSLMSLRYMRLQALLPLVIHAGEPRSALVIGLGTGITCGALLAYPPLSERVCVELLPAVVDAASHFRGNFEVTADPRITLRVRDGRHELLGNPARYDLITLEPPPPDAAGVVNLYSREFYEICRARLAPQGVLAQWWPLALGDGASRSLVRSLLDVFPYVTLWTTEAHETMLVASGEPIVLDVATITARFELPSVRDALAAGGVSTPAALLATYVTDRAGLERFAGDAPPVTDDRPRLEYTGWGRAGDFATVVGRIFAVRSDAPLRGSDAALVQAIDTQRRTLMTFYQAVLDHYAGDRESMGKRLAQVAAVDPQNPYFLWFVGR